MFDSLLGVFPPGRLVDLGAGHGKFSMRAADAGWDVTAVDARSERFTDDERVAWVQEDVRSFDAQGFDLILCLGLYYHLTLADQLELLRRASGVPMIIDTHVATKNPTHPLSRWTSVEGYKGRLYSEKGWQELPTASWGNTESFWPAREEFYRMLSENGYPVVMAGVPWIVADRTFFLCLPEATARDAGSDAARG